MAYITVYFEESGDEERRRRKRRRAAGVAAGVVVAALALYEKPPRALPAPPVVQVVEIDNVLPLFARIPPRAEQTWPELPKVARRRIAMKPRPMPIDVVVPTPTPVPPAPTPTPAPEIAQAPVLPPRIEPRTLHFAAQGWKPITITNPHATPIRVDRITVEQLAGRGASGYDLLGEERCIGILQPGASCRVTVFAGPAAVRSRQSIRIAVFHDGSAEPASLSASAH